MFHMQMHAKRRAGRQHYPQAAKENKPFLAAGKPCQLPKQREQSYNKVPALTKL